MKQTGTGALTTLSNLSELIVCKDIISLFTKPRSLNLSTAKKGHKTLLYKKSDDGDPYLLKKYTKNF